MSRFTLKGVAACTLSIAVAATAASALAADKKGKAEKHDEHWAYTGKTGPQKWGDLEKDFAECKLGQAQSPIDIPDAKTRKGDFPTLLVNYKPTPARIVDNGHTI